MPTRMLPVPEGLAGMRADAGIARLLGLSRTRTAAVLTDGGAEQDGHRLERSDRLEAGGRRPRPRGGAAPPPPQPLNPPPPRARRAPQPPGQLRTPRFARCWP
ncbi:MAG: hypothetical protein ABF811_10105, partial [Pseudoclavibacter sp.]